MAQPAMQVGQKISGFHVEAVTHLKDLQAVVYQARHEKSGARFLHVSTDDSENLFSISFPTPPPDDSGVPHILEHSVLSGSEKFPVRDPFFELTKMSMATFINAMTGWDRTFYPVASNVKQDLLNLAEVYFDAVFHPLLSDETFKREAHHLAPVNPDDPLGAIKVTGIVYNEMKGVMSDPEALLYRQLQRSLFPDTCYANESGGDPEAIPKLTHEGLKNFHKTYYHPSNSYIVVYGNIPTSEYMEFLNPRLNKFDAIDVSPEITKQPRWSEPRWIEDTYPVGKGEGVKEKTYLAMSWLCADSREDPADLAALDVLGYILVGNDAAPLKKALIDSKLGQDILFAGTQTVGLERTFLVGIKGSEPEQTKAFHDLVFGTLSQLAEGEIPRDQVEAAFQQSAYSQLEIGEQYPLKAMQRVLGAWVYGMDPLTFLNMKEHLDSCRQRYEENSSLFNQLIKERLLQNPHYDVVTLRPDPELQAKKDAEFKAEMKELHDSLSKEEREAIAADHAEVEQLSGEPNPPEAIARLPQLKIGDLPDKPRVIPTSEEELKQGLVLLRNDVFANGINYFRLHVNCEGLSEELWPYVPFYMEAVRKMGAADMDFVEMAKRRAAATGGFDVGTLLSTRVDDPKRSIKGLTFSLKTLDEKVEDALGVMGDLLFSVNPRDTARLKDLVIQARAYYRSMVTQNGFALALYHAGRGLSPEGYLSNVLNGLPQLELSQELFAAFEETEDELIAKVEAVRDFLLVRGRITASFTGSDAGYSSVRRRLEAWSAEMRDDSVGDAALNFAPSSGVPKEGLAVPSQVAYCVHTLPAPHFSDEAAPLLEVGARLLQHNYLLPEIRLRGNAYGAQCMYNSLRSTFTMSSYRDPHVARTLQTYDKARGYIDAAQVSQEELNRLIISSVKSDERPIRPGGATGTALVRHLLGMTEEKRQERYSKMISATPETVKQVLLDLLQGVGNSGAVTVVAGREMLEEANKQMTEPLEVQDVLD